MSFAHFLFFLKGASERRRRGLTRTLKTAMSSRFRVLAKICSGLFLIVGLPLLAQDNFVLVTSSAKVQDVCGRHGLTQVTQLSSHGVFLVSTFSVDPSISTDSDVQSFEHNRALGVPELSGATSASLTQSTTSILHGLPGRTIVNYFGAQVASNYVTQPATAITILRTQLFNQFLFRDSISSPTSRTLLSWSI